MRSRRTIASSRCWRPSPASSASCGTRRIIWGSALANIHPGKDDTYVDYHNDARPPLLFITGKQDHLFPPKVGHSNAKHYKSKTVTEIVEFDGPHLLPAIEDGRKSPTSRSIGR